MFLTIFFPVFIALITARFFEWLLIATIKTFKEHQEKKLIERIERAKRAGL